MSRSNNVKNVLPSSVIVTLSPLVSWHFTTVHSQIKPANPIKNTSLDKKSDIELDLDMDQVGF